MTSKLTKAEYENLARLYFLHSPRRARAMAHAPPIKREDTSQSVYDDWLESQGLDPAVTRHEFDATLIRLAPFWGTYDPNDWSK